MFYFMPPWFMEGSNADTFNGAAIIALAWIAKEAVAFIIKGKSKPEARHRTFADNETEYWQRMREVVTAPLAEVLRGTNGILTEMRDRDLREEGRREVIERREVKI
jgi:hypothetical protein